MSRASPTKASILDAEVIHEGFSTFMIATVRLEDGTEVSREIEDYGAAVAVLPYDPDRRIALLVRVLRPPLLHLGVEEPHLFEAPAGLIEGEAPDDAARREVEEETGVRITALESLGAPFSSAGVSTERLHLYLAAFTEADRVGAGGGLESEHENLSVVETPLPELWRQALAGEIRDLKTLALCLLLRSRRPKLFETE